MKNFIPVIIILITSAAPLKADVSPLIPDTVVAQFAGYTGFMSSGAGYEFLSDRINLELFYGYVPESEGGIDIHMLTLRSVISPLRFSPHNGYTIYLLTFGFFVNYAIGDQYKVVWPSVYPEWYYRPTALYTGESIGIRIKKNTGREIIKAVELYADIVTMSEYLYEYIENDRVKLQYIISLAIGMRLHF